jgi:hypothetical protein
MIRDLNVDEILNLRNSSSKSDDLNLVWRPNFEWGKILKVEKQWGWKWTCD